MCRLFGMTGSPERVKATFWLLDAPDSLSQQSHREPDGAGLGTFDAHDAPAIDKWPIAAFKDRAFAVEAREARSRTFLGHIRFASTGACETKNTHPFTQKGRLFALITKQVEAHSGSVGDGISAAVRWVAEHLPLFAVNLVLTTPDELWALRYPDTHGLFVLERAAGGHHGSRHLDASSRAGTMRVRSDDLSERPAVVIASEPLDDNPAWKPLESGELLHVDRNLKLSSTIAIDRPPKKLLTMADLKPEAARSQQATAET